MSDYVVLGMCGSCCCAGILIALASVIMAIFGAIYVLRPTAFERLALAGMSTLQNEYARATVATTAE